MVKKNTKKKVVKKAKVVEPKVKKEMSHDDNVAKSFKKIKKDINAIKTTVKIGLVMVAGVAIALAVHIF